MFLIDNFVVLLAYSQYVKANNSSHLPDIQLTKHQKSTYSHDHQE